MFKLKSLEVDEFRGLRKFRLDFGNVSYAIYGANGSGKSSITVAIEFCLTGKVSRFTGVGTGGLTQSCLKHTKSEGVAAKTKVSMEFEDKSKNEKLTVTRSLAKTKSPEIISSNPNHKDFINELQKHPELILTRKELTQFIVSPSRNFSDRIQHFLRIEHIRDLSNNFNNLASKCSKKAKEIDQRLQFTNEQLCKLLKGQEPTDPNILSVVNFHRVQLRQKALENISPPLSFMENIDESVNNGKPFQSLVKRLVIHDCSVLLNAISSEKSVEFEANIMRLSQIIGQIEQDTAGFAKLRKLQLVRMGLNALPDSKCPLCENDWDGEELRAFLEDKLSSMDETAPMMEELAKILDGFSAGITQLMDGIQSVAIHAEALRVDLVDRHLEAYSEKLSKAKTALADIRGDYSNSGVLQEFTESDWWIAPDNVKQGLEDMVQIAEKLPDKSNYDEAMTTLALIEEKCSIQKNLQNEMSEITRKKQKADEIVRLLDESISETLNRIFTHISEDFAKFYRFVNDDEIGFSADMDQKTSKKLEMKVDFHDTGKHLANAYHSEGHQDIMGLCLFLALMKNSFGDRFSIAVLDDVLMSVDAEHRRLVCRLLLKEFPKTQFIFTTHDRVWLDYMRLERLIQTKPLILSGWNIDVGPRHWNEPDVWNEIQQELENERTSVAASILRRYLEFVMGVLAENLEASVKYSLYPNPSIGSLMPSALKKWKECLKQGIELAKKEGYIDVQENLSCRKKTADLLVARCLDESQVLNKLVHSNEHLRITRPDLESCVRACKELLNKLRCQNSKCGSFPYVVSRNIRGESYSDLRCNCGKLNVGLERPK